MPLIDDSSFNRAIANIAKRGDTDVFPLPIENHVLHDRPNEVRQVLREIEPQFETIVDSAPIASHSSLAPVGYFGFRWATQIDPIWNAYLLAAVLQLAPAIEARRVPESAETIFSYRYREDDDEHLFAQDGWAKFQAKARELAETHHYVVSVDIADFYSRIYHHPVENALRAVDPAGGITRQIKTLLTKLSDNSSYGLPVGGPAARLLAELALNRTDRLLLTEDSTRTFARYADDYRFFVNDLPAAYRAIGYLSENLLRLEGLSLQKAKTRIMTSAEYLANLTPVELPSGSAAKFLSLHIYYDPYSDTATEDYERLRDQIQEFDILGMLRAELMKGRVNAALTRRLVKALKFMDSDTRWQAVVSLMSNIETLAPVIPQVMSAIRDCLSELDDDQNEQIHADIRRLIDERHHVAQVDLNLAYMLRVLNQKHSNENEALFIRLYNSPHGFGSIPAPYVQRDIMLSLARWEVTYWLGQQKNYIASAHPWVRRAFVIASYALRDEGHHWRLANRASLSPFDIVVRDWAATKSQIQKWSIPV